MRWFHVPGRIVLSPNDENTRMMPTPFQEQVVQKLEVVIIVRDAMASATA